MRRWALLLILTIVSVPAFAADFPSKPIQFLVPYPSGGGTDIVARLIAQKLEQALGQPVVVDNRPGGNEIVATNVVARSAPDGHTIALMSNAFGINVASGRKLPFNADTDFTPVAYLVSVPFLLVINPGVQAETVQDLVALIRKSPGTLNYASLGSGSPHQLAMEWFKKVAAVEMTEVPYRGVAAAMTAAAAGEVQVMFTGLTAGLAQAASGQLKALAVSPAKRVSAAPKYPTIAESGFPRFDINTWYGVIGPARMAPAVTASLNTAINNALRMQDVVDRCSAIGAEPGPMSTSEFSETMRKDVQLWSAILQATGLKLE